MQETVALLLRTGGYYTALRVAKGHYLLCRILIFACSIFGSRVEITQLISTLNGPLSTWCFVEQSSSTYGSSLIPIPSRTVIVTRGGGIVAFD